MKENKSLKSHSAKGEKQRFLTGKFFILNGQKPVLVHTAEVHT